MNIQELINSVKEKYSANNILEMLDEEIFDWDYGYSEDEIEEEYDCRWDFYQEYNNGEAETSVVDQLLFGFGTSRNKLFEEFYEGETCLLIFEEWLSNYTLHNFNV
jgi:hypothetical protein